INDPMAADPDDATNTVWHVAISGGPANVYLESQDLADDPLLSTGFNFSGNRNVGPGGDPVGEIVFDMMVNSIDVGTNLWVKLDSGYPNLGQVIIPASEIAVGAWKTYSIKFDMLLANPLGGGSGVDLANVLNPFVFEVTDGAADVFIDKIRVTNACKVVGACGADLKTKGVPDLLVFDDVVNTATWTAGIGASDSGSGYADYFVGTNPTDKVNWSIITSDEPERGEVIEVTFNDSAAFGVWFVKSSVPVDTNAYNSGAVVFDLKVLDYGSNTTGMTFKIDCDYPCTSGDKSLGVVADGVWETITFPVSRMTSSGLDLSKVNTGIVIFPTTQAGGITFQLDNIRWVDTTEADPLAQIDLPVTFDDPAVDYSLIDFEGTGTAIVVDPAGGTNNVASTTKGVGAAWYAGTVVGTGSGFANAIPFAVGETTMSVRVYSPAANIPVMLKIENADASAFREVTVFTTVANEWETLVFDYSTVGIDTTVTFVQAIIFFDFSLDVPGDGSTYYWDDLYFGEGAPPALNKIDLPVTFDDPEVNYYLEDFEGAATVLANDPIVGASNTVAMTTKNGQPWAGTIIAAPDAYDFASPIPFSVDSTSLTVRVLSPAADIPVMLKIENADASSFLELTVNTTVSGEWETLEFDYSTLGIDTSIVWVRAIIFFDFLNDANGASYHWDDVQFVNPPAQTKIVFDEAVDTTWDAGVTGSDEGCGWCGYTDPASPNKSNWQFIADEDVSHGQVIDITFKDSGVFGVWFIGSSGPVDMTGYADGNLIFDIKVVNPGTNTTGFTMKVDCGYPCTSGDQPIGLVGTGGVWETVTVPVSQLTAGGLNLGTVNTGLVIFPNWGEQAGGVNFRLDNIRWEP
ncbi:MAG: putative glycoside hydrolase, partial [Chromatiales bacterium]|nr:putative glycoside hydrolase [Chromatiales bacterium]